MRNLCLITMVLASLAVSAGADDITLSSGLSYKNVTIRAVAQYGISYRVAGGTTVRKGLSEIRTIYLSDGEAFNKGEAFLTGKEPDPAKAVAAYDQVDLTGGAEWLTRLVQYRRVVALDKAAMTDRATKEWLLLMDADEAWPTIIKRQPTNLAAKGSAANAAAITMLETKLPQVSKRKDYAAAVQQTLMRLYRHEGLTAKADELANKLAGAVAQPKNGGPTAPEASAGSTLDRQLDADRGLIRAGQTAENLQAALSRIRGNLRRYDEGQLGLALLLKGKCQSLLAQSQTGPAKKALLLSAGLDLMRVVAYYEASPDATEALYEAGKVNLALGNKRAARRALEAAARSRDTDLAAKAKAALADLK